MQIREKFDLLYSMPIDRGQARIEVPIDFFGQTILNNLKDSL